MPKTPLDYDLIAIFIAVAEEKSFSKAAIRLGIGKGTVSRAIAELEEQLAAELIHRTTHAVALSTAGTALYERTAKHLRALDEGDLRDQAWGHPVDAACLRPARRIGKYLPAVP